MGPKNLAKIQNSFMLQAENFENIEMNFSNQEYLGYSVKSIVPSQKDNVLEVAAGTCVFGRTIASFVNSVVCVDATPAMLKIGMETAEKASIPNIQFLNGFAEKLPFKDCSFDIVMTRMSFHHFTEIERPFAEMHRVLKKGGKLVIIDMEAAEQKLRKTADKIETLRDSAHEKNRSREEFLSLYRRYGYQILKQESTPIPVSLQAWMNLTKTSEKVQTQIRNLMQNDIWKGIKTGFAPYLKNNEIYFNQRWLFLMGTKEIV